MRDDSKTTSRFGYAVGLAVLFIGFVIALKLPSLAFDHDEPDEVVYWTVAEQLHEHGVYTLRGSEVLPRLSARIYDRPLFHHPPLYPLLLVPFVAARAPQAAVVVSWLGHLLCVLSVALIGGVLLARSDGGTGAVQRFLWLPLLGVATDPILTHVSRKLWIDSLFTGLAALALALVYVALDSRHRRRWLVVAGVVLGLAGLAKVPALLVAAVIALLLFGAGGSWQERIKDLLCVALPATLLVLPWFVAFVATYGVLTPTWLEPDDYALQRFPFVAAAVARPWYYYLVKLCLVQPLAVVAVALYVRGDHGLRRFAPLVWFLLYLGVNTFQGATGYGFQMRYLAPLTPAVYVMLCCHPSLTRGGRNGWVLPLLSLGIVYAAIQTTTYLLSARYDELMSFLEFAGWVRF